MINILEIVYGGGFTPNINPIHKFDPDTDLYEHAEFEKENGDFYQIVKISNSETRYHFQKIEATIEVNRLEGNWWLRHDELLKVYKDKHDMIFYEKINDRIIHGYRIKKLVSAVQPQISELHPDFKAVLGAFIK